MALPTGFDGYEDLFTDCVLYYDMNADAKDVTNNNNDGIVNGATLTTDRFGIANKAYTFDAINDDITTSSNLTQLDSATEFTLHMWCRPSSVTLTRGIWGINVASATENYAQFVAPDEIWWVLENGASNTRSEFTSTTISTTDYGLLSFVYDGSLANTDRLKIYYNGVALVRTTTVGTIPSSFPVFSNVFEIGKVFTSYYGGEIGELFIYTRAFSISEVQYFYDITKNKNIYETPRQVTE